MVGNPEITVIVPVYIGLSSVKNCLDGVLAAKCHTQYELLVIYDCGPDDAVERLLDSYESKHKFHLIKNSENLGFVRSVNKAAAHAHERNLIILNSDTIVPDGWIDKLIATLSQDPKIGTITPFSNNAEIMSLPLICRENHILDHLSLEHINDGISDNTGHLVDLPTGVGFCMLIARKAIESAGYLFDEELFGKGYGEENDFCQRIQRLGFRNVACTNLFVSHVGGVSFGEEKISLIQNNLEVVAKLHPKYISDVSAFISDDPLKAFRFNAVLGILARQDTPTVVAVGHGMGGGTKKHMDELERHYEHQIIYITIEPASSEHISLKFPIWLWETPIFFKRTEQRGLLFDVIRSCKPSLIHIHHIKGIEHTTLALIDALRIKCVVTLHDYYFIGANPTLTDGEGVFDADRAFDREKTKEDIRRFSTKNVVEWQSITQRILNKATTIIAPDVSTIDVYKNVFPNLSISEAHHLDSEEYGDYPAVQVNSQACAIKVVVLGALSKEKGADVLEGVANLAASQASTLTFELLGYAYRPLSRSVLVHGSYSDEELKSRILELSPDIIWFPCQWPETYSYTLSTVLELGLPLAVPTLGALYNRTRNRPYTIHVDHRSTTEQWYAALSTFSSELRNQGPTASDWSGQPKHTHFYRQGYLNLIGVRTNRTLANRICFTQLDPLLSAQPGTSCTGEAVVRLLMFIRVLPGIRKLFSFIPIDVQRRLKRILTRRPIHEISRR